MGRFDCCTVWRNHYEFAKRLDTAADKAAFMMWVIEYQLDGTIPEDDNSMAFSAFKMIVPSLDFAMKQRENGGKGGRRANPSRTQTVTQPTTHPTTQTVTQTEASRARVSETVKSKNEIEKIKTETKGGAGGNGGGELLTGSTSESQPNASDSVSDTASFDSGDKSRQSFSGKAPPASGVKGSASGKEDRRDDWKGRFEPIEIEGYHTFQDPHHYAVDLALTLTGERTDLARNTMRKYLRQIGEKGFRTEIEMFYAEVMAGEDVENWAAALTARMKRLADSCMARRK